VNEVNNAATLGANYRNPLKSFFPVANATIKENYLNAVNNTSPFSNYFLSWNSIAPSGIDYYNSTAIPNWQNSILITSLKRRRVYRLQLDAAGTSVISDTIPLFPDMGRYRDVCISSDGTKIYVSCDSEGQTSGPTAGTTIDPPNKGCILEFTYAPQTGYCASKATLPWEYAISNVKLNTLNNTTDKFKDINSLGYSDYTALNTTLNKGQTYPLSITPLLSWIGNLPNAYCRVWIDFNQNKTFEANELVLEKTNQTPFTQSITIPTTATLGNTRMRVSMKFGSYPTACETFDKGEVEDYTVIVTGGTVSNSCLNSFVLKQYSNSDCTSTGVSAFAPICTLEQYGQNIADGFMVRANFFGNYTMMLFARNGTTTQPAGSTFTACTGNWVYFTTYGTIINSTPRSFDSETNNVVMRVRTVGNPTNADSIYVEFQGPVKFVSVSKKRDCNTCYATDVTPPVIRNCPTGVPIVQLVAPAFLTYNLLDAQLNIGLTDDCPIDNPVLHFNTPADNKRFVRWGDVIDYKLVAFDSAGHRSACAFKVRFANPPCSAVTTPPTIVDCPTNISVQANFGQTCAAVTWTPPTATAAFNISTRLTSNYASGFCFPIGTTPVIYTATDSCGNTATCTFNVTVTRGTVDCTRDVTPPVFVNCPPNQELTSSDNGCNQLNWIVPTVTDLCSTPTLSFISKRGSVILFQSATGVAVNICPPTKIDTIVYTARDAAGNTATCQFKLTVITPTIGIPDMSINMSTTPSVYKRYSTHNFRVIAINSGTTAFTNVKIKFTRPALTASGGTKTASIGTFKDYCAGGIECSEWTIPTLAAGITATLDAPVYVLAPTGAITANATLLSSTPTDNIVGNNTTNISVEPAIVPIAQPLIAYKPTQLIPIVIQKLSPTITESEIDIELESLIEKTIDFTISNAMGQQVLVQQLPIEKGMNKVALDVSKLPQGLYFIQTNVGKGRAVPTKFVKL
jgi:hypothetical protein